MIGVSNSRYPLSTEHPVVTAAGVDTWSTSWYVNPDGQAATWLREHAVADGPRGSKLLAEKIEGHRVGWFPAGLVFAEGHPDLIDRDLSKPKERKRRLRWFRQASWSPARSVCRTRSCEPGCRCRCVSGRS